MADLDFSELDKAVNDVMADGSQSEVTQTTEPAEPIEPVKLATPATRRQGRFMDIIRPTATAPVATIRHQGATIQPRSTALTPPSAAPVEALMVEPTVAPSFGIDMDMVSTPEQAAPTSVSSPTPTGVSPMAEPTIEMATSVEPATAEAAEEPKESATPTSPTTPESEAQLEPELPLSSPFLPNVDVEKRPLGGFSDVAASSDKTEKTTDAAALDDATESLKSDLPIDSMMTATDDATDAALAELNKEHPNPTPDPISEPAAPEPNESVTQSVESPAETVVSKEPTITAKPEKDTTSTIVSPEPRVIAVGGSIAQQYAEAPSTSDQTNGAIYDTKTYNKPIKDAPVKKKKLSVAIWILWAVGLALIGGIAAGAYFYMSHH